MPIHTVMNFFKKYKAVILYISLFIWAFVLSWESLFANTEEPVLKSEDAEKVVKILNGIITLAAALMGMITSFITMFLYPGWTNGTLFWLQDYLKEIWILISNVVYFIFAFILIAIAFMNIIGKWEGTWELKQAMPKFIVWVLIVPFSWFFVQFVLSISAILTVGVLTLPYDSFKDKDLFQKALEDQEFANQEICKDVIISFNGEFEWYEWKIDSLSDEENELDEHIKCRNDLWWKVTIRELITGQDASGNASANASGLQNSVFGIISIYSYWILKVDQLDTISATDLASVKTIADLIFKIVFDVLFIIVYLLLMVALLLALFVRWVRLWIYMMLSPAFWLLYFFWKGSEWMWETGEKFNIKEFIALALVPVYVSAALAFGLVFILVAGKWITLEDPNEPDTMKAGWFTITMIWAQGWSESWESSWSVIGKLIAQIFGVVILWIAVMAALWASKTTKTIVEPIQAFWKSVGDLAAKAPTYAPIIPTWKGQMQSAASLKTIWSSIQSAAAGQQSQRAQSFMDGTWIWWAWWWVAKLDAAAWVAADNITRMWTSRPRDAIKELRSILREKWWSAENIRNSPETQRAITATAAALWLDNIDGVKLDDVKFNSDRAVVDILSAVDRKAWEKVWDSESLFEGNYWRNEMWVDKYKEWISTWKVATDEQTPPPVSWDTNNTFKIQIDNQEVNSAKDAANRLGGSNLGELEKAMDDAWVRESTTRSAIIAASRFSQSDKDWNWVADSDE